MGLPILSLGRLIFRLPPTLLVVCLAVISVNSLVVGWLVFRLLVRQVGIDLRWTNKAKRRRLLESIGVVEGEDRASKRTVVGLFHPYCNAGGGGERVLWTAVAYHQRQDPDVVCAVYSGDVDASKDDIIAKAKERFDIELDASSLIIIPLERRYLVEDSKWPRFTLLGQSLGSVVLGWEAITSFIPDIYIDTMGYAFTLPLFRHLGLIPVGAYVHYPTISTEMIHRVAYRQDGVTNSSAISSSWLLSHAKLLYYVLFLEMYSLCLRQADHVMVNSSWTKSHIDRLLRPWLHRDDDPPPSPEDPTPNQSAPPTFSNLSSHHPAVEDTTDEDAPLRHRRRRSSSRNSARPSPRPSPGLATANKGPMLPDLGFPRSTIVYPPCAISSFTSLPLVPRRTPPRVILSLSQFRPEKAQDVQIKAVAELLNDVWPEWKAGDKKVILVLAGSVRNEGDEARVRDLKALAESLGIRENVRFEVNVGWDRLRTLLGEAIVGMSTMVDEHFGISVVEFMAAGLVPLVHASGGPRHDIVVPLRNLRTGFYGSTPTAFAHALQEILEMDEEDCAELRSRARRSVQERFGGQDFERGWRAAWDRLREVKRDV